MELITLTSDLKLPGMILPLTATAIKTKNGVVIHSPIAFTPNDLEAIKRLGEVSALVAPSLIHHVWISKAKVHFPNAKLWGVPGLREKRPRVAWDGILGTDPWPFEEELPFMKIQGMPKIGEHVFFHKASKTLVVVDLCFNIQNPKGFTTGLFLRGFGTFRRFAVSRLYCMTIKDKIAFRNSIEGLMSWDFDRIQMSHGESLNQNGKPLLKQALAERGL